MDRDALFTPTSHAEDQSAYDADSAEWNTRVESSARWEYDVGTTLLDLTCLLFIKGPMTDFPPPQPQKQPEDVRTAWFKRRRDLAVLQGSLAETMTEEFEKMLEKKWTGMSKGQQKKLMWMGLKKTVGSSKELMVVRRHVPEVNLVNLLENDGKPFLTLIRTLVEQYRKSYRPEEAILFNNSKMTTLLNYSSAKYAFWISASGTLTHEVIRNHLIATFIWETLIFFLDVVGSQVPESAGMVSRIVKRGSRIDAERCESCRKGEDEGELYLEEGMKQCDACKKLAGRMMYYCSEECQRTDWQIHRPICARLKKQGATLGDKLDARIIPPSRRKRSAALSAQIASLEKEPRIDYVLFKGDLAHKVIIKSPRLKREFEAYRYIAIRDFEPVAVLALLSIIGQSMKLVHPNKPPTRGSLKLIQLLCDQLEAEYGKEVMVKMKGLGACW